MPLTKKLTEAERARNYRARHPEKSRAATRDYMRRARQDGVAKVYFIQAATGPIKIGFTTGKVETRLKELQPGNPDPLVLLAWIPAPKEKEAELHRQFAHLLIRGEWFRPAVELLQMIQSVKILGVTIV